MAETATLTHRAELEVFVGHGYAGRGPGVPLPVRRLAKRRREEMLGNVEERKPAAIRSREVVCCFDDDLDCLIAGIHLDLNLRIFKIYFMSTAIRSADDGVWHVSGRLPMASRGIVVKTSRSDAEAVATDASNRWIFEMRAFSIARA